MHDSNDWRVDWKTTYRTVSSIQHIDHIVPQSQVIKDHKTQTKIGLRKRRRDQDDRSRSTPNL